MIVLILGRLSEESARIGVESEIQGRVVNYCYQELADVDISMFQYVVSI